MATEEFKNEVTKRFALLVDALKKRGYKNNTQIAKLINQPLQVVSKLLSGERIITLEQVGELCINSNANSYWLLTGKGGMFNDPELISLEDHPFISNEQSHDDIYIGVPYYDLDVTATIAESFSDVKEDPEFYVDFKPFNDCSVYLPVFGDSMYPLISSGEIVALKRVDNREYIQYGEPHLVITNAVSNNMRTLKIIRKHQDDEMITLKSINPSFDDFVIPRSSILSLYIVKGKITRRQL